MAKQGNSSMRSSFENNETSRGVSGDTRLNGNGITRSITWSPRGMNGMSGPSVGGGNWINYLDDRRIQRSRSHTASRWELPSREWQKGRDSEDSPRRVAATMRVMPRSKSFTGGTLQQYGMLTDSALAAQFAQAPAGSGFPRLPKLVCERALKQRDTEYADTHKDTTREGYTRKTNGNYWRQYAQENQGAPIGVGTKGDNMW